MKKDLPLHVLQIEHMDKVSKDKCSQRWFQMDNVSFANAVLLVLSKVILIFYSFNRHINKDKNAFSFSKLGLH